MIYILKGRQSIFIHWHVLLYYLGLSGIMDAISFCIPVFLPTFTKLQFPISEWTRKVWIHYNECQSKWNFIITFTIQNRMPWQKILMASMWKVIVILFLRFGNLGLYFWWFKRNVQRITHPQCHKKIVSIL